MYIHIKTIFAVVFVDYDFTYYSLIMILQINSKNKGRTTKSDKNMSSGEILVWMI